MPQLILIKVTAANPPEVTNVTLIGTGREFPANCWLQAQPLMLFGDDLVPDLLELHGTGPWKAQNKSGENLKCP